MSGAATAIGVGIGLEGLAATMAGGAILGAGVGGISSAIQGGDIGMGILGGGLGGAVTGGMGSALGGEIGGAGAGAIAGGMGGAVNSAVTGGDIANGALMGGAMGGVTGGLNDIASANGGYGAIFGGDESLSAGLSTGAADGSGASAMDVSGATLDGGGGPGPVMEASGSQQGALTELANSGAGMSDASIGSSVNAPGTSSGGVTSEGLPPPEGANINMSGAAGNPNNYVQLTTPDVVSQDYLKSLGVGGSMSDTGVIFDMARADQIAQQAAHPDFMDSPLGWAKSQTTDFLNKPFSEQLKLGVVGLGALGTVGSMMGGSSGKASPAQVQGTPSKYWNTSLPSYGYAGAATPTSRPRNQYTGDMTKYGYGPSFNFFDPRQMVQMAEGGAVRGPGGPKDDMIHAKLSDGEFVIPTDVVNALGNGNNDRGAGALHQMMATARKGKRGRRAA